MNIYTQKHKNENKKQRVLAWSCIIWDLCDTANWHESMALVVIKLQDTQSTQSAKSHPKSFHLWLARTAHLYCGWRNVGQHWPQNRWFCSEVAALHLSFHLNWFCEMISKNWYKRLQSIGIFFFHFWEVWWKMHRLIANITQRADTWCKWHFVAYQN